MTAGADAFADAPVLVFGSSSTPTPTAALTDEAGEPSPYASPYRTAWWKVTVPRDCDVSFDLLQSTAVDLSSVDTWLGVYTWDGTDFTGLTQVAYGNDAHDFTLGLIDGRGLSETEVTGVTAGTTFYVQAGLFTSSDDCSYVLRVAEYTTTWGDWIQRDDIESRGSDVSSHVGGWTGPEFSFDSSPVTAVYGGSTSPASTSLSDYQAAADALAGVRDYEGSGAGSGFEIHPSAANEAVSAYARRLPALFDPGPEDPGYHFAVERAGDNAELLSSEAYVRFLASSYDNQGGDHTPSDMIQADVATFWIADSRAFLDYFTANGVPPSGVPGAGELLDSVSMTYGHATVADDLGWIDLSIDEATAAEDRVFGLVDSVSGVAMQGWSTPLGGFANFAVSCGFALDDVRVITRPPLIRYGDKALVPESGVIPSPTLIGPGLTGALGDEQLFFS